MAEATPRQSALARAEGVHGAAGRDGPGVRLGEWRAASIVQVGAFPGAEGIVSALVESIAGMPVPRHGSRAAASEAMRVFATGPGRWALVARDDPYVEYALVQRIAIAQASIVDLTHSRTVLRLAGARARDVLAKGCTIDLDARAFDVNGFAQTRFGQSAVWLHQVDAAPSFDLFVYRGFARALWEELRESALEYGVALEAL
jgi:sarcosine oxidase subunit gamma